MSPENAEQFTKSTIFVRNLPLTANSQDLERHFEDFGPIKACFVVTDKAQPGKSRRALSLVSTVHSLKFIFFL